MNTTLLARALLPILALVSVSACKSAHHAPPGVVPDATAQAPQVAAPSAPVDAAPAVEDEFQRLLAGMGVRFFPHDKLEVSGWVNMQSGLIEVFACAPQGKTHEAVVVLDCVPSGLHAGLMALELQPGSPVEFGSGDAFKPPTGDPVSIEVRWQDFDGVEHLAHAEDWIWDARLEAPMPRGAWIFTGSFMQPVSGESDAVAYAADYVKSLATTYYDASTILENPRQDGVDDTLYASNEKVVPPVGTPITAIFRRGR